MTFWSSYFHRSDADDSLARTLRGIRENVVAMQVVLGTLRLQASGDAEIKNVPRHFARANQADRCITLLHCAQRLTP